VSNELPASKIGHSGEGSPQLVAIGAVDIDRVRNLWEQMRLTYLEISPQHPIRGAEESWARRRATYEKHLSSDSGFILGLEGISGHLLAFAAVKLIEPSAVFAWSDVVAELETLVVEADVRSGGLGAKLLEAVRDEARARGCGELQVSVLGTNERASRFYRRLGFTDWIITLHDAAGAVQ
jgi:ribosomal protein S18 acetylase RimI-like enzyme